MFSFLRFNCKNNVNLKITRNLNFGGMCCLQKGIVRAKFTKILAGFDDVHYERSFATGENIKLV